jgi:hypothetical protein
MQAVSRPPNRLLQVLPAAEFQSLSPHLETVELAKGSVLTEAGAPPAIRTCLTAASFQ